MLSCPFSSPPPQQRPVSASPRVSLSIRAQPGFRHPIALKCAELVLDGLTVGSLVDQFWRKHHQALNVYLLARKAVLEVEGGIFSRPLYVVSGYEEGKKVLQDSQNFSSNPYADGRLVALNTMNKEDHLRVLKVIKKFYSSSSVSAHSVALRSIFAFYTQHLKKEKDLVDWARMAHMHSSLLLAGASLSETPEEDVGVVRRMVEMNTAVISLVAPLGGIGRLEPLTMTGGMRLVWGLISAVWPLAELVSRVGLVQTWKLIRPELNVLSGSLPSGHAADFPELIKEVPAYFNELFDLMMQPEVSPDSPLGALRHAVCRGELDLAEALVVIGQLLVNMTTANALLNELESLLKTPGLPLSSLARSPPLMRNPRSCVSQCIVGGQAIPAGSVVLVFLGACNLEKFVCSGDTCTERGVQKALNVGDALTPLYSSPQEAPEMIPFSEPLSFEDKATESSLTFGFGRHYCLGKPLVEAEMGLAREVGMNLVKEGWTCSAGERMGDVDVGNYGFSELRLCPRY